MTTNTLFATAATADRVDAGVGVIWWATHPAGDYALSVLDYDLYDVPAINAEWVRTYFERSAEMVAKHKPAEHGCPLRVEHAGLINILERAGEAYCDSSSGRDFDHSAYDLEPIKEHERARWAATLDERMDSIRPLVNSGKVIRPATGLRGLSWRAIKTNHLKDQIRRHRPGDAASAGELLQAFMLGVLLATTPKSKSLPDFFDDPSDSGAPDGPFGAGYIPGVRPR